MTAATAAVFKPTRRELSRVRFLATECEIDLRATSRLGLWFGMHRPAQRAAEAFALSAQVAARAAQPVTTPGC